MMMRRLIDTRSKTVTNLALGVLVLVGAASPAMAGFEAPSWRGEANTTYQEWNTFTTALGLNEPDVAVSNPNGDPTLQNLETTAFLTGGGNLYSFAAPLDLEVTIPTENLGADWTTTIFLQIRSLGTEVDPASVILISSDGTSSAFGTSTELSRTALGGFGGDQVETLYSWEVSGNASSYILSFAGLSSSLSLDAVSVDTRAFLSTASVPEPTTLVSVGLGLGLSLAGGLSRARRRAARAGRARSGKSD
jgi:hypothetical protein